MRICKHCNGPIPPEKNMRAEFCSNKCKTDDYRERKGIATPDFLLTTKPMNATNEQRSALSEEQKHTQRMLRIEIANFQQQYDKELQIYAEIHSAITQYNRSKTIPEKYRVYYKNHKHLIPKKPPQEPTKPRYENHSMINSESIKRKYGKNVPMYDEEQRLSPLSVMHGRDIYRTVQTNRRIEFVFTDEEGYNNEIKRLEELEHSITKNNISKEQSYNEALSEYKRQKDEYDNFIDNGGLKKDDGVYLGINRLLALEKHTQTEIDKFVKEIAKRKEIISELFAENYEEQYPGASDAPVPADEKRITGNDVLNMRFQTYNFNVEWSELLNKPSRDFSMMVFGDAKAGKSYFCLLLAEYLTGFGDVAYFAIEEGLGETMKRKIEITQALNVFIHAAANINDITAILHENKYKFAFIDSASSANMKVDDFKQLKSTFPKISFLVVLQTTKSNNFRGEKEWKHEVDAILELTKPAPRTTKITCEGRFGDGEKTIIY